MAEYVVVDKEQLESDLTVVADAIREKGGTSEALAFPNGMKEAVMGIQSGGENLLDYAMSFGYLFYKKTFPTDYDTLTLNVHLDEQSEVSQTFNRTFANTSNLERIVLSGYVNGNVRFVNTFQNTKAHVIDLSNLECTIETLNSTFMYTGDNLQTILGELDLSSCTNVNSAFGYAYKLKNITFKANTIKISISFVHCHSLSNASIQSIIDGLADLTGGTAQTVEFHADVKAKLTDEQKTQITSKNWILA